MLAPRTCHWRIGSFYWIFLWILESVVGSSGPNQQNQCGLCLLPAVILHRLQVTSLFRPKAYSNSFWSLMFKRFVCPPSPRYLVPLPFAGPQSFPALIVDTLFAKIYQNSLVFAFYWWAKQRLAVLAYAISGFFHNAVVGNPGSAFPAWFLFLTWVVSSFWDAAVWGLFQWRQGSGGCVAGRLQSLHHPPPPARENSPVFQVLLDEEQVS